MERQKYSYCEHCDRDLLEGECLSFVDYWKNSEYNARFYHSYLIVCDICYDTRHNWCEGVFPDNCDRCGAELEYSEQYIEYEAQGKHIPSEGLTSDECRIICKNCFQQL
jgi:hypothetical protein